MGNNIKNKSIKGFYSVWEKTVPGEMNGQKLTGSELAGLFAYIRSVPISDRYSGDEEQRLIAFHGDNLTGDSDFVVPADTDDFIYGLFMKKRDMALPRQGTQTDDSLVVRKIEIGDKSFMFEVSYFMVDKVNGIVLLLNNRNVGFLNQFRYYLNGFLAGGEDSKKYRLMIGNRFANRLNAAYIPAEDVFGHLARFARVSQLIYKLGGREGQSMQVPGYSSSDEAMIMAAKGNSIDDMESLGGFSIEVKIRSKRNGSLDASGIRRLFNNLSSRFQSTSEKKQFKIEGRDKNGQTDALDFISDDIMLSTSVSYEGRYVANVTVFEAMRDDFLKQRPLLVERTKNTL